MRIWLKESDRRGMYRSCDTCAGSSPSWPLAAVEEEAAVAAAAPWSPRARGSSASTSSRRRKKIRRGDRQGQALRHRVGPVLRDVEEPGDGAGRLRRLAADDHERLLSRDGAEEQHHDRADQHQRDRSAGRPRRGRVGQPDDDLALQRAPGFHLLADSSRDAHGLLHRQRGRRDPGDGPRRRGVQDLLRGGEDARLDAAAGADGGLHDHAEGADGRLERALPVAERAERRHRADLLPAEQRLHRPAAGAGARGLRCRARALRGAAALREGDRLSVERDVQQLRGAPAAVRRRGLRDVGRAREPDPAALLLPAFRVVAGHRGPAGALLRRGDAGVQGVPPDAGDADLRGIGNGQAGAFTQLLAEAAARGW